MKKKSTFLIFIILLISCLVITIFVFDLTDKENFEFFFGLKNPTDYVSDDFQTLHLEGVAYERIETPFDMVSPREPNSQYSILFANAEYKHSNLYTESTSKRYPFVWISDTSYHLYINTLTSSGIKVIQISNEDTDEIYTYCLREQYTQVMDLLNNVSWNDNLVYAEQVDNNNVLVEDGKSERLTAELSQFIIDARSKFSSEVNSHWEVSYNDNSRSISISVYQYDDDMNFRKKLFDIRVLEDGTYYLYDSYYMCHYSSESNASVEGEYDYLIIPELYNNEIINYQNKYNLRKRNNEL